MSRTEDCIMQGPGREVLDSTHASADRSKLGLYSLRNALGSELAGVGGGGVELIEVPHMGYLEEIVMVNLRYPEWGINWDQ